MINVIVSCFKIHYLFTRELSVIENDNNNNNNDDNFFENI